MLSKNQIRYYQSLTQKKYRNLHGRFLAEGEKLCADLLSDNNKLIEPVSLILTARMEEKFGSFGIQKLIATDRDIGKISSLQSPQEVLLEAEIPDYSIDYENAFPVFFFEEVRDPGNLGTIMRTADWFGVNQVFVSENSVELYNPKVVQSTMGSISRVMVHYLDWNDLTRSFPDIPVYATTLDGENIYKRSLCEKAVYMFGNEARGLSREIIDRSDHKLSIPNLNSIEGAESLNLSVSAAVFMSEIKRQAIQNES